MICKYIISPLPAKRPLPFSTCFIHQSEWTFRQQRGKEKKKQQKAAWGSSYNLLWLWEYWKSVETYHCCCLQSDPWLKKWGWLALDTLCKHIIRYYDGTRKSHGRINSLQKGVMVQCNRCFMCISRSFCFSPSFIHSFFQLSDHSNSCTAIIMTAMINFPPLATLQLQAP